MRQYRETVRKILTDERSYHKLNRTGVDTITRFGHQTEYDLQEGFPLLTTKKLHIESIFTELLWFLRGEHNVRSLQEKGVTLWNEWADENGELGPIYGYQWRSWPTSDGDYVDQIQRALKLIREDPTSRRIIVNAWNVGQLDQMALPPCHLLFQFDVRGDFLDCQLYQRSCDTGLGVPFNIASYAAIVHLFAQETGLKPGVLVHTFGNLHIYCGSGERGEFYRDHLDELKDRVGSVGDERRRFLDIKDWIDTKAPTEEMHVVDGKPVRRRLDHVPWLLLQSSRELRGSPRLEVSKGNLLEDLVYRNQEDVFRVVNYNPHPRIRMDVAA